MTDVHESSSGRPFVFVLMPFSRDWDDVYHLGIKPACEAAGATCERADEQIYVGDMLRRLYGEIARATIVVAEMTGKNPNVFYEAGYAHGIGRPVVFLTRVTEDIPFDLRHYPHVIYGGRINDLRGQLEARIRWCLQHPRELEAPHDMLPSDLSRMAMQIENYLASNNFKMVSLERIQELHASYTPDEIQKLIEMAPHRFRPVKLKGGRRGISIVGADG